MACQLKEERVGDVLVVKPQGNVVGENDKVGTLGDLLVGE